MKPHESITHDRRAKADGITITALAELPHAITHLAQWFHDEWNKFDGRSIEQIATQLRENLNHNSIPLTFVAHNQAGVLGTVSLDVSDLDSFDHFSPWLASLYVEPDARSAGIATALVQHVQQFAASHGIPTIYLWTPGSTHLYERCGWVAFERTAHNGVPITIMRFERCRVRWQQLARQ